MRAEFKRDVSHNYLILQGETPVDTSTYQVRMLIGNVIPFILKCHLQNLDEREFFYYDITSKQSIAMLFEERKFQEEDLQIIFEGIIRVMENLTEFLMNPDQLVLQPEYIYMDAETRSVYFCCLPGFHKDIQEQFRNLVEYILPKLQHEDNGAVKLGYGIYRKTLETEFQLETVKAAIYQKRETVEKNETADDEKNGTGDCDKEITYMQNEKEDPGLVFEVEQQSFCPESDTGKMKISLWKWGVCCCMGVFVILAIQGACFWGIIPWLPIEIVMAAGIGALAVSALGMWILEKNKTKKEATAKWRQKIKKEPENIVLENNDKENIEKESSEQNFPEESQDEILGETVMLSAGLQAGPASLVSREPGELATIFLDQELTVVGKLMNAADVVIPLSTVSRVHARIKKRDGEYYLADLNSRNGTSVNGRMLKGDEEYLLQDEDQVDFAQARYVFVK